MNILRAALRAIFTFRFSPSRDLIAVLASWTLVTGTLYIATVVVTAAAGGGMPYFFLYAVLGATLFGIGIPLYWTVVVRKRPIADLGITTRYLGLSLALQLVFAAFQYMGTLAKTALPAWQQLLPLLALSFAIGLFEAVFWRGWVLLRLEDAFGLIPAVLLGSALYALYHIGYAMPLSEIAFLFLIGVLYAVTFRLTRNIFVLWPLFQPMGQMVTLLKSGLSLPLLASLGFFEVLILMAVLIWLANRSYRKQHAATVKQAAAPA